MTLPGLPSSIASSPSHDFGTGDSKGTHWTFATNYILTEANGRAHQFQVYPLRQRHRPERRCKFEVDTSMREVEEKRAKRTAEQQQLHDAMLSAIFKSVFEDTVPDSADGIYSSGKKDRMGCDIPKVIDFRSLPVGVQDDLMKAEILPTMWPRYRISGYERMFHYCLMTVTKRKMLFEAGCHHLTPAGAENKYPSATGPAAQGVDQFDDVHSCGPPDIVDQLILAAFECAISILRKAGSLVTSVLSFNAYQLDLFLFKDMGIGGILAKFIGRMNDPEIGGYEGYSLPEPVATWYGSVYTDYMTYLDIAGRDSVLAAQVASPGTQVTIQFIAMALEQAEDRARANEQSLHEYLENKTITDFVEQFTQDKNCEWLMNHSFQGNVLQCITTTRLRVSKRPGCTRITTCSRNAMGKQFMFYCAAVVILVQQGPLGYVHDGPVTRRPRVSLALGFLETHFSTCLSQHLSFSFQSGFSERE